MLKLRKIFRVHIGHRSTWHGYTDDNRPVMIDYRYGYLSIEVGDPGGDVWEGADKLIYEAKVGDEYDGNIALNQVCDITGIEILNLSDQDRAMLFPPKPKEGHLKLMGKIWRERSITPRGDIEKHALEKLESRGLVRRYGSPGENPRLYVLTELGCAVVMRWLTERPKPKRWNADPRRS